MARQDTTVWERLRLLFIHSEAGFDRPSLWQRESFWPGEVRVCGYLQLPYFVLGPEGNGGIQHGKNGGGGGGGGGGPLNLRPGFPGPNPAPGTGGGGGRNEVHGAALDLLCALLLSDLEECSLSSVETWLSFS